jgi:hypothetical protein
MQLRGISINKIVIGKGDTYVGQNAGKFNKGIIFIMIQMILYVTFLTLDLKGGYPTLSSQVKFCMIILCFCYALFHGKGVDKSIFLCVKIALFFTVISDLFILILDFYVYGVLTFILVQLLYAARLQLADGSADKSKRRSRAIRFLIKRFIILLMITFIICLVLQQFGVDLDGLLVVSAFYFLNILTNTVVAVIAAMKRPYDKSLGLFAVGMTLFLLCDINVGLFNISGFVAMPEGTYDVLYPIVSVLMWTFYAPSQVLIALSANRLKQDNM